MRTIAVIPARMGSTRFPGKPLAKILGKTMIEHVYRKTARCRALSEVLVATCDREIASAVERFGGRAVMTSKTHERATDRTAEVARKVSADVYVMVQGDEPMLVPDMISRALAPFKDAKVSCVNLAARIETKKDFDDPNTIKVVADKDGDALYFSREPIPAQRAEFSRIRPLKQVCVIPFRKAALALFSRLTPTPLEKAESIDMLRFLEHGRAVRLVETPYRTQAVDTPQDLRRVERLMRRA